MNNLIERLSGITNMPVSIGGDDDVSDEAGGALIIVEFADGTCIRAGYWRLIIEARPNISNFDHKQKYGLPAPIDARKFLSETLKNKLCLSVRLDVETADIILNFVDDVRLRIFAFTAYEVWEIIFPDGTGEYSNHAMASLQLSR